MPTKNKTEIIILSKWGWNEQLSSDELITNTLDLHKDQPAEGTDYELQGKLSLSGVLANSTYNKYTKQYVNSTVDTNCNNTFII